MALELPTPGGDNDTWGDKLNAALTELDQVLTQVPDTYVAADQTVTQAQATAGYMLRLVIDYLTGTDDPEPVMVSRRHTDGATYRAWWLNESGLPRAQAVSNEPTLKLYGPRHFFPTTQADLLQVFDKWQGTRTLLHAVAWDGRVRTSLMAWTSLAPYLQASFTDAGDPHYPFGARCVTDDVVELRGRVNLASGIALNQVIAAGLPAQFRPTATVTVESVNSGGAVAPMDIAPDGTITARRAQGTATWTAFDGKRYTL